VIKHQHVLLCHHASYWKEIFKKTCRIALCCSQEDVFAVQKMVSKPESGWEGKATEAAWPVQLMHMRVCSTALELA
jgi:hypothetical protein